MLTFTCPCCGVAACRMGLAPGREAHPKRVGPGSGWAMAEEFAMTRSREGKFIDESVAAGVVH